MSIELLLIFCKFNYQAILLIQLLAKFNLIDNLSFNHLYCCFRLLLYQDKTTVRFRPCEVILFDV